MGFEDRSLDDKYDLDQHRILISGTQAIVRLALTQQERDKRAGINTAAYVTGYRGSPLGSLDQQFWRAANVLEPRNIVFQPGINEDLATTAMWGAQQAEMRGEGRFDGVFGLWYGKGPGVDRAGDALRHANLAGTSPNGGVVALMGDDHTCESSTTAHQSEFAFVDAMMPILNPAGVQEILDYGLLGYALSRYAGLWVGMKCVKDNIESTATIDGASDRVATIIPQTYTLPSGGLNIRPRDNPLAQEERLHEQKIPAALAFLMANAPDRIVHSGGRTPRLGIVTAGKSYLDVLQAFDELGIDEVGAANLGIRVLKIACVWPLEPLMIRSFARGLERIMVVEEKRGLIEPQIKEILYGLANAPKVIGKKDEVDEWLFPSKGVLDPNDIAVAIGERTLAHHPDNGLESRVAQLKSAQSKIAATYNLIGRTPYFCAGCPHNSSTIIPDGSRAYAGIGCHYMVQSMDRATEGYTQMGAEGANWVGEAPFSTRGHVFQNIGDGTYNHSGSLAIRAAAASGINITYKILFNDAVALTGGQPMDGGLTVERIANQVAAEGAERIAIVSDEPFKYPIGTSWPLGTTIHHRDEIDEVQRELAKIGGLSIMIYDQTCAAEKRRRRKRGNFPDPDQIVVINELVCEGCGDCGVQSNCVAIVPVETEFGRKRAIDQSTCNKDFSCVKGFCPSFVTVHGAKPHARPEMIDAKFDLPEPSVPTLERNYAILIAGVGGTGVVTIGAILAMAAHIEGKHAGAIDMAGLAQKGGAVTTHLRLAPKAADIKAIRVAAAGADLLLGCDMVVAGEAKSLAAIEPGQTSVVVNTNEVFPGEFTRNPDYSLPSRSLLKALGERSGADRMHSIDATKIATALLGNSIATNMFLLGFAWQKGAIPLSRQAIEQAVKLNGVEIAINLSAFAWGRRAAIEPEAVADIADGRDGGRQSEVSPTLDSLVERRAEFLAAYQDKDYAERYSKLVARIREAEARIAPGQSGLGEAVAVNLFRLMAVKDEYEVARLFIDGSFRRQLRRDYSGWQRLEFHLAPPFLGGREPATGHLRKRVFGPWMIWVFRILAKAKRLRGTRYDIFGYSNERRTERELLGEYEETLEKLLAGLTTDRHQRAIVLASWPEGIRGFGHVKEANITRARAEATARLSNYLSKPDNITEAAE